MYITVLLHCFHNHHRLILGVVPKPASQVASSGEAGGERHQAAGQPIPLSSVFWSIHHQLTGLWAATGALALHPYHVFGLPAVVARLYQLFAEPSGRLRSLSSPIHASILASVYVQLHTPGTQPSPAPHQLYVPPATHISVLCQLKELKYSIAEDESQGAHSVYWEDMVMLFQGLKWTRTFRR